MTCSLYRHFAAGGRLLYVGISGKPMRRLEKSTARGPVGLTPLRGVI
jgi:hypothetical protein